MTQDEINEEYPKLIKSLDEEIIRVKSWANENGHQVHTAAYPIIRRYRDELKMLQQTLRMNIE